MHAGASRVRGLNASVFTKRLEETPRGMDGEIHPQVWLVVRPTGAGSRLASRSSGSGCSASLEAGLGRTVLPLFRIGTARGAIEGDLSEQLRGLAGEAGVRQAL